MAEERPTPEEEARRLYEEAESRVAKAAERVVSRESFGEVLAMATENVVALTRIGFDAMDLVWSNLRLAGRRDITRLARQLGRTEDKLEQVLQEVERLREQVDASRDNGAKPASRRQAGVRPPALIAMNALERIARTPIAALEFANIVLTERDAQIAVTPKDVVWTHRTTTLYRYRSSTRTYAVPVLLVFALINRPDIFDLRPGNSFVEFLLDEGYDVFLLDWGVPDEADADLGLEHYVCDEIPSALREVRRASGQEEVTLLGWCIGGTLSLLHCALEPATTVRNLVLLTTPIDTTGSLYATWVARDSFDVDRVADVYGAVPGRTVDWANKLMKPVTNYWTTYRRLWRAGARRRGAARRLPGDGQVGGRQPAVPRPCLPRVDHVDVQGEPPGSRAHAPARAPRRPVRDRAEPARGHGRRGPHRPA